MNPLFQTNWKAILAAVLLLAAILAVVYAPVRNFGFTNMDDTLLIVKNQEFLKQPDAPLKAFLTDVFPAKKENDIFYRPLLTISFWVDYQFCGTSPRCYHLTNLVLHFLAVIALFSLLLELTGKRILPAFGLSALYALNPLLTTAVAFLPGRNDSLLSLFLFASFYFLIRFAKQKKPAFAVLQLLLLVAAFFTKENAVLAVPLFALWLVLFQRDFLFSKKMLLTGAGWSLALILFFLLRQNGLQNPPQVAFAPFKSLVNNWFALPHIAGKFFTFQNLQLIPIVPDMDQWVGWTGLALLGGLLLLSKNKQLSVFGISWFVLLLLPAMAFTNPAINYNYHYEHRTHTALLGLLLLVLAVFEGRKLTHLALKALVVAGLLFAVAGGWVAHQYSLQVSNENSYFSHAVSQSPHCSVCWGNYAFMQFRNKDYLAAETSLRKALTFNPENPEFYTLLAKLYLTLKDVKEAQTILNRLDAATEVEPFAKYASMTRFFVEIGDAANARTYLDKARIAGGDSKKLNQLEAAVSAMPVQ